MKKLRKAWKEKIDLSIIYKCFLVILDTFFINLSSFLALWIRFNMHISEIEPWYSESVLQHSGLEHVDHTGDICGFKALQQSLEICEYQGTGLRDRGLCVLCFG